MKSSGCQQKRVQRMLASYNQLEVGIEPHVRFMARAAFLERSVRHGPHPAADCDGSGTLSIDDAISFQTLFALG
jgi:hypothetical protein